MRVLEPKDASGGSIWKRCKSPFVPLKNTPGVSAKGARGQRPHLETDRILVTKGME